MLDYIKSCNYEVALGVLLTEHSIYYLLCSKCRALSAVVPLPVSLHLLWNSPYLKAFYQFYGPALTCLIGTSRSDVRAVVMTAALMPVLLIEPRSDRS